MIEAAGYFVSLIGLFSLLGYAYEVPALCQPSLTAARYGFTAVAMTTALLFIALGANLLALRKDYWFASIWASSTHGGELLRTFIPLIIALPIMLGFAKTYLERAGVVNSEVATTVIVVVMIVGSVTVLARLAARFDKIDRQREKNEKQKQDLLYALAHDMKIPLIGCDKMLELVISNQFADLDVQKEYLLMVKQSNETLLWMIQNLIYENQRERGLELTTSLTNLSDLMFKCVEQIKPFAQSKELDIDCSLIPDLILELDAEAIRLVLMNVLHNAVKFTNKGRIEVSSAMEEKRVVLEISDTGTGIAPEYQARIFDRIWQSDAHKRNSAGGTNGGLGLHLCQHIMEAHGGRITYADRVGGGAIFSLAFPRKHLAGPQQPTDDVESKVS